MITRGLLNDPRFDWTARCHIRCLFQQSCRDIGDLGSGDLGSNVEIQVGDLRKTEDCRTLCANAGGSVLVHTAGVIHPRRVREFYEVNVEGTRNILSAAAQAGVRRAIVISSNSPCGCNPDPDQTFDEHSPYCPYLNYGRSKMMMEENVRALQALGQIETVVLRPPWFYGPYQSPRQTLFFDMIRRGLVPVVGKGLNRRSMCYIDNLCQAILLASTVPQANGETYWIADASAYTVIEIIDTIEQLLENEFDVACAHRRVRLPALVGQAAWLIDSALQAIGLYHQKLHVLGEMNKTIVCRIDKAVAELGYAPHIDLVEGMRRSLSWLKDTRPGLPMWAQRPCR